MTRNRKLTMEELGRKAPEENLRTAKRPIVLVLDNIRSGLNVGSILRSADAFGIEAVHLCGITACPPDRQVLKSALGAETSVHWEYHDDTLSAIGKLPEDYLMLAVEQTTQAIELHQLQTIDHQGVALIFGNELSGVSQEVIERSDECLVIPQSGHKHSLNVAVCAGIVLWELIRTKYV